MQAEEEEAESYFEQTSVPLLHVQTSNGYESHQRTASHIPSEGFVLRYDPGDQYVAIGCYNGEKLLYSFKENAMVGKSIDQQGSPVTCMRWRPFKQSHTQVIAMGTADGNLQYYHIPSMKLMFQLKEEENSILCCDYSKSGSHFATAGKDCNIRIYDEEIKCISVQLGNAEWNYPGHSNRIFSIKFLDDNTMVSGGWDSTIHIWDIRQAKSANAFYGPHVSGDSIDVVDNQLLVGCYASKSQIQLWDIRNLQQMNSMTWPCGNEEVAYVYTAGFSHFGSQSIIAGACGVNEVRVFTRANNYSTSVRVNGLSGGCYCVDSSYKRSQIGFVTAKKTFYIYSYKK